MREFLIRTSHRPRPLPSGRWVLTQRWNNLLFAHWPVAPSAVAPLLPEGLELDVFQGSAWIGIVPFRIDGLRFRGLPAIPSVSGFPELNLRTYVRDPHTGTPGVFFLSADAANLVAVGVCRALYHLPYYWSEMSLEPCSEREFLFKSRRRMASRPVQFEARYRSMGPSRRLVEHRTGSLEYFLTERHCLFSVGPDGAPMRADLQHMPWPLEDAEAEIEHNDLAAAMGIVLPDEKPVLHYSRRLVVYLWRAERLGLARQTARVPATVIPST